MTHTGNTQIPDSQETKLIFKKPQFKKLCYQPQHNLTIQQKQIHISILVLLKKLQYKDKESNKNT